MIGDIIQTLRQRYGEAWGRDEDIALKFSVEAEYALVGIDGVHLIGEAEVEDGQIVLTVWVDVPIHDLFAADELAFRVFARLSEEIFYTERRFEAKGLRYPFVTGSASHGHIGALVMAGPHAAEFAERHRARVAGGLRYHA